jgi:hypothetical protein
MEIWNEGFEGEFWGSEHRRVKMRVDFESGVVEDVR